MGKEKPLRNDEKDEKWPRQKMLAAEVDRLR
jgi:hypothetical protein